MTHDTTTVLLTFDGLSREDSVDVLGEMDDWLTGQPLRWSESDARHATTLKVSPGIYSYKFKVNKIWTLAPGPSRTRSRDGQRNHLLVVRGAEEPLLFAPYAPYVLASPTQGVRIVAGLRKGSGSRLVLHWRETNDAPWSAQSMDLVEEEDEHLIFQTALAISTPKLFLRLQLPETSIQTPERDQRFEVDLQHQPDWIAPHKLAPTPPARLPDWWLDGVLYTIFVDRFRSDIDEDWPDQVGRDSFAGGTLNGIRRSLVGLRDLGISILYLTPIHAAASCHRYDATNWQQIDPRLGTLDDFQNLLQEAHALGIRILVDLSFSHAGIGFEPFEHVLAHGKDSPSSSWFQWVNDTQLRHYGLLPNAPMLNLAAPDVQKMATDTARFWAGLGVDGFRIDAAAEVPTELLAQFRSILKEHRHDGIVLAELVPSHAWRWAGRSVDAVTNFAFQRSVLDFVIRRELSADQLSSRWEADQRNRAVDPSREVHFLSTHDHPRAATLGAVQNAMARVPLAQLLLFATSGPPMLLYGEELGLHSNQAELTPEAVWNDRMPMPWTWEASQHGHFNFVQRLLQVRSQHASLRRGIRTIHFAQDRVLVFRKSLADSAIDVVVNASDESVELELTDDWFNEMREVFAVGEVRVRGTTVVLGPCAGAYLQRKRTASAAWVERIDRAQAQALGESFSSKSLMVAHPSRIEFSVTEACNLRCLHCINDSPRRTRTGTARTMPPVVLDRLREDFVFASQYAFVHGGESITSRRLFDTLRAIQHARGTANTIVHLLSNGMLLTERACEKLAEHGVNSLAVSLDGASGATNDRLRLGSQLEVIVGNLRRLVRMRQDSGWDLRLGVSTVVTLDNVGEMVELVELCASIGVDWVKFEEIVARDWVPVSTLIHPGLLRVRQAIAEATTRARTLGLVAVDHTIERHIWLCDPSEDPDGVRFLKDDGFAHRTTFHPCQALWTQVCVEPNGDIKLGSFQGVVLGNVLGEPLSKLWNNDIAQSARAAAQREWRCSSVREMGCLSQSHRIP